jgi:2-dehydro-3-deoxygluconokinase
MAKRVLAIGECMAELAPAEQAGQFSLGFAGDTFNTAWYLARIAPDVDVRYLTAVGDDKISQDMRAFMKQSGISDEHVQEIAGETVGLYLIHLDIGERSFSYWRSASAAKQLATDASAVDAAMADVDLIYFSGITLAILDAASRDTLFAAFARARDAGKQVAFDTNLRPRLWAHSDEMKSTIMQAAACADIVLPSYEDEADWFGDASPRETLERYASAGVTAIIVKNGAESVLFQSNDRKGDVSVDPVTKLIDTTAAGDSFNAGVFAGLVHNEAIVEGIKLGCRLAGQVGLHKGALVAEAADQFVAEP